MEDRVDRLAVRQGIVHKSEVTARGRRVEFEVGDWMDVIRVIMVRVDPFGEEGRELLIASRFRSGPGGWVVEEEPVSMVCHLGGDERRHERQGVGGMVQSNSGMYVSRCRLRRLGMPEAVTAVCLVHEDQGEVLARSPDAGIDAVRASVHRVFPSSFPYPPLTDCLDDPPLSCSQGIKVESRLTVEDHAVLGFDVFRLARHPATSVRPDIRNALSSLSKAVSACSVTLCSSRYAQSSLQQHQTSMPRCSCA